MQVGCGDLADITGRIEDIAESQRSIQFAVHQLLPESQVHIPESIGPPLRSHGRADKITVQLDTGRFAQVEGIIPDNIVIRALLVRSVQFVLVLYFVMIQATIQVHIPPTGKLNLATQLQSGRIIVTDIRHRVQRHTRFIRNAQTLDLIFPATMENRSGNRMLTDILLIIKFERVDIFRTDIRITDFCRIIIAIGNIRFHKKKFRPCDTS